MAAPSATPAWPTPSLVAYEFGRHAAPGPVAVVNVVAATLSELRRGTRRAGRICSPERASPPGARRPFGSTRWEPTVEVRRDGADLVLNGEARLVESAGQAAHLLVTCNDGAGVTQVLVPAATPGVTIGPMETIDLTRRFGVVTFDDVRVPAPRWSVPAGDARGPGRPPVRALIVLLNAESVGAMQAPST